MNRPLFEYLDSYLFNPRSIAVVGASNFPGKWGFNIINRVLETKDDRKIYAINNKRPEVAGLKAYKSIRDVPEPVEFVVIAIPYIDVPTVVEDCVAKGVKAGLVVSAGLGETGEEGVRVEREIVAIAKRGGLRFVGPNCMGHFNTASNFFTTGFVPTTGIVRGHLGIVAQSGGFAGHILRCAIEAGVGLSKLVSSGNEADLHLEDYLEYLAQDPETKVIGVYIEGFREGRRFLKLAREITRSKPIVAVKVGRTEAGAKAARGHTGALSGSDIVSDAVLKQSGVIRADEIEELFDVAAALLRQPLPKGRRIGILTGGGGHGVVATDACSRLGLEIATLSGSTLEKLDKILPERWPRQNPVDTVAAGFVTYPCLWPMMEDENIDAILSVGSIGMSSVWRITGSLPISMPSFLRDQAMKMMDFIEADEIKNLDIAMEYMDKYQKPIIITSLITSYAMRRMPVFQKLRENGLIMYPTPERSAKVLHHLCWYSEYLRHLES
ncbi:MAG: CoA-binding protein [Dehalococcoidia bacterium]|nr:CoA-binding protein [Dehalococcoidia bacterium]